MLPRWGRRPLQTSTTSCVLHSDRDTSDLQLLTRYQQGKKSGPRPSLLLHHLSGKHMSEGTYGAFDGSELSSPPQFRYGHGGTLSDTFFVGRGAADHGVPFARYGTVWNPGVFCMRPISEGWGEAWSYGVRGFYALGS